jgi:hypothetical protein
MGPSGPELWAGRIVGVEAEVRRLRWLAAGAILAAVTLAGYAVLSRPRPGRLVVAGGLEIRDDEGRLRGSFGLDHSGLPAVRLFDHRGHEQVALSIPSDDTSELVFSDRGTPRVTLFSSIEGTTFLKLHDPVASRGATLNLFPDGKTGLTVVDGDREARWPSQPSTADPGPLDASPAATAAHGPAPDPGEGLSPPPDRSGPRAGPHPHPRHRGDPRPDRLRADPVGDEHPPPAHPPSGPDLPDRLTPLPPAADPPPCRDNRRRHSPPIRA